MLNIGCIIQGLYMPKGMKGFRSPFCSKCKANKELENKRYCRLCSNAYTRKWRKTHPLTADEKFKSNVRRKLNMRIQRGKIQRKPCEQCGEIKVEAHHDDYNKPYEVRWLCRRCHIAHHKELKYSSAGSRRVAV